MTYSATVIRAAMQTALDKYAAEVAAYGYKAPENHRGYACHVAACSRPAYAGGYCNAHYLRSRKGSDLSVPLRTRAPREACRQCGRTADRHGGWGLCKKHYKQKRRAIMKDAAVALFGGACYDCGGKFPVAALDFHHVHSKRNARGHPSKLMDRVSVAQVASDLAQCLLVCANCHRIRHANAWHANR